jgi:signal transduction histidine kinase
MNTEKNVILVVDDTPANLSVLSEALTEADYEVAVAMNGENAIKQSEYDPPDLILLDVQMPGIDGFKTCEKLKTNPLTQHIPVIFMTALNDAADKVKGFNVGAVDYITKPFQQEEVLARVRLHLSLRNLNKTLEDKNLQLQLFTQQLEQKVQARTLELSQSLQNLQQTQLQLMQSEKMSTIGQLVAGIAHEINNPLTAIICNIKYTEEYFNDLLEHLHLYQHYYPDAVLEIQTHRESIELDFLTEDLSQVIDAFKVSANRIGGISNSLRTFCRADTNNKVLANIHEGIDSTLLILRHRLKANEIRPEIKVIKEYGNLPLVKCHLGQLNQVFMNILANAIDALEDSNQGRSFSEIKLLPNTIIIKTEINVENQLVIIKIQDNGKGISEEIQAQIFEHLFTTKSVGKGTGLGLSISRQIVEEKHGGSLICNSVIGQGTQMTIALPLNG